MQNSVAIYEVIARFCFLKQVIILCPLSFLFFFFPWEITGKYMTLKEEYEELIFFRDNEFHFFFSPVPALPAMEECISSVSSHEVTQDRFFG